MVKKMRWKAWSEYRILLPFALSKGQRERKGISKCYSRQCDESESDKQVSQTEQRIGRMVPLWMQQGRNGEAKEGSINSELKIDDETPRVSNCDFWKCRTRGE